MASPDGTIRHPLSPPRPPTGESPDIGNDQGRQLRPYPSIVGVAQWIAAEQLLPAGSRKGAKDDFVALADTFDINCREWKCRVPLDVEAATYVLGDRQQPFPRILSLLSEPPPGAGRTLCVDQCAAAVAI